MSECSLPATERLKSTKIIQQLFAHGQSFSVYPVRVVYLFLNPPPDPRSLIQVAFSVGKRKFPKAVTRNLLKRRMRECYRLQKTILHQAIPADSERRFVAIFLYIGKEPLPSVRINGAVGKILKKLAEKSKVASIINQPKD